MAIAGAGAGVNELTALAATSEMAPTRKRGVYVSVLVFTIVPFGPAVLWAQLIAYYSSWRYVGALCGAWNGFGLLITVLFYFPPPRANSVGLSKAEIISRVDYVGGLLSILGLIIFLAGMQWGGYMVCTNINFACQTVLIHSEVPLDVPSRSGSVDHWLLSACCLRLLGNLRRQISYLPDTVEARASHSRPDSCHHLHFWCEFLFCAHVLAHRIIQRVWP